MKFLNRIYQILWVVLIIFIMIGVVSATLYVGTLNRKEKATHVVLSYKDAITKLKIHLDIASPDTTLYIQRAWSPTTILGTDTVISSSPLLYEGEFLSTHREIRARISTYAEGYFSPWRFASWPEALIVIPELKASDTLFYYNTYSSGEYEPGTLHTYKPIGYIAPDGNIGSLGNFVISRDYLEKKFLDFRYELLTALHKHGITEK